MAGVDLLYVGFVDLKGIYSIYIYHIESGKTFESIYHLMATSVYTLFIIDRHLPKIMV